jgi:RHH-type proline utilization regulon transcriptional repressor/proline dehydrogenase/delta 1-pyrroline-5-carboxylate dehydrogenase
VREHFDNATHQPLGPVVCISPWNFPLAIFMGQVTAALAAGNVVLAKPAEQTPLIAHRAVQLFHEAGVPAGALQLLPGRGETVGAALTSDPRVKAVIFTGSTEVAQLINRTLAKRSLDEGHDIPLIAETGGQNALIVDSSALPEQVVRDVLISGLQSAGQRCSALRLLCVQDDIADRLIEMIAGAVAELKLGDPRDVSVQVGPVIDGEAQERLDQWIAEMAQDDAIRFRWDAERALPDTGTFVPPVIVELPEVRALREEVFGPVLHVVRWRADEFEDLLDDIAASG